MTLRIFGLNGACGSVGLRRQRAPLFHVHPAYISLQFVFGALPDQQDFPAAMMRRAVIPRRRAAECFR